MGSQELADSTISQVKDMIILLDKAALMYTQVIDNSDALGRRTAEMALMDVLKAKDSLLDLMLSLPFVEVV